MADFLDPCGTQESAVVLQELLHAARVGRIPLVEEKLGSGVPTPSPDWVIGVEEQLLLFIILQLLGFSLVFSEPGIRGLQILDQLGVVSQIGRNFGGKDAEMFDL